MNVSKKLTFPGAVVAAGVVGVSGASLISGLQAGAASTTSGGTSNSSSSSQPAQADPSRAHHTANGVTEQILTGDNATKAKAAAEEAVAGATVIRLETDAEGAAYEAHMAKSDGSRVTVKMDSNFKVTGTESGFGNGMAPPSSSSQTN